MRRPTGALPTKDRHIGLARRLSKLGYCSRSDGFELVRAGRVTVNGQVRLDPEFPVRDADLITVDGEPLSAPAKIYLAMNKPRGVVTTAADEQGRPTVYSLLDPGLPWVGPIGRLDQASEGLLLFTNDSEWAASITAPGSEIAKTYQAQISCVADETLLASLRRGVSSDGELLRAASASIVRTGAKNSWIEIVLHEGRNRQIRRMLKALDIDVLRLVRVSIGPIALGDLAKGAVRPFTKQEKAALDLALSRASLRRPSSGRA